MMRDVSLALVAANVVAIVAGALFGALMYSALFGAHRDSRRMRAALTLIQDRLDSMPTQQDLDAAIAGAVTAFNTGIDALETAITTEAAAVLAKISAISGVPQEAVDAITAFTGTVTGALATAQGNVGAMLVTAPPVPVLVVTPTTLPVAVGATAAITDTNAAGPVTFTSSDATIATVDTSGNVTGVAAGSCTVTVTDGTTSVAVAVTVS